MCASIYVVNAQKQLHPTTQAPDMLVMLSSSNNVSVLLFCPAINK